MKKAILFISLLALTFTTSYAQKLNHVFKPEGVSLLKEHSGSRPTTVKSPFKVELEDNQLIFGPYTTDDVASADYGLGVGYYTTGTVRAAVMLPTHMFTSFDGGEVVKMRVGLAEAAAISRVFIAPIINGEVQDDILSQTVSANKSGWSEFEIEDPVTLDMEGVDAYLMGFDYNQQKNAYPISTVDVGIESYNLFIYGNLGNGTNWYGMGNSYGNLSIQAIVEKDFDGDACEPMAIGNLLIPFGSKKDVSVTIRNIGKNDITSINYTLEIDGQAIKDEVETDVIPFSALGSITIPFPSADTEKTQNYTLTIDLVNGADNEAKYKSVSGLMASSSKTYDQNVLVEEHTGTGCPWCPRGYVGMEKLRETYPDRCVGIALHQYNSTDAMFLPYSNYADLSFSGAPSCLINRLGETDPYYGDTSEDFGISRIIDYMFDLVAETQVKVSAQWNQDATKVEAKAAIDGIIVGAEYNVEFVLIGDDLTGTTSGWNQSNNFYQYTETQVGSKDLAPFCKGGKYGQSSVKGLHFNDVALSSSYSNWTNEVSPITIESKDRTVEVDYELSLPTSQTLLNALQKDQVYVAAIVIDPLFNCVVNVTKTHVTDYTDPSGVVSIQTSSAVSVQSRYALDGRQLSTPQKGLNIVHMSDGSVRKVIVK